MNLYIADTLYIVPSLRNKMHMYMVYMCMVCLVPSVVWIKVGLGGQRS